MSGKTATRSSPIVSGLLARSLAAGLYLGIAALGLAGMASTTFASPITVPTGLSPGDQYRLVFVTSTLLQATSPDIADYNTHVNDAVALDPLLAALGATWTAIASTTSIAAKDNTTTNPTSTGVAIFNLNGGLVATNNADLWDNALNNPIAYTESGTAAFGIGVWTGSAPTGTAIGAGELGSVTGFSMIGFAGTTTTGWITAGTTSQNAIFHLYAISSPLTVAAVPEPGTLILYSVGLAFCAVARRRTRNRRRS